MSGYDRTGAPVRRKKYKLTRLRIDEVSSVDRGAGHGVRVVLTKRHQPEQRSEPTMSEIEKAQSNVDLALAEQQAALKLFPESKTVGEALAKFHATDLGRRVQNEILQKNYRDMQNEIAFGKAGIAQPMVSSSDGMDADDGDEDEDMPRPGGRTDGSSGGMHRNDNSRPPRRGTGEHVNEHAEAGAADSGTHVSELDYRPRQRSGARKALTDIELTKIYRGEKV